MAAYAVPGRQTTGVWLVARQDGSRASFVDRSHLPPTGQGWQYYWLGNTFNQAAPRIGDALSKLGVTMDQANAYKDAQVAFTRALQGAAAGPKGNVPAQAVGNSSAQNFFQSVSDSITSTLDFLKFIAWFFSPRHLLRVFEFLVGAVMMGFGIHAMFQARGERIEGFSTSEDPISRSGLGRVATELGRIAGSGAGNPEGESRRPRPRSAPHKTRQRALAQRYRREEDLQRRRAKAPRPKQAAKKVAKKTPK